MLYGADYNPEQWPEQIWPEDVERMREAGVNIVSLAIFSWSRIQPAEDRWDFEWLDRIIDLLHAGGIRVNLATATASPPPWASIRYPEILPQDEDGTVFSQGSRQAYAPSSPVYRRLASELVRRIAERYVDHPAVVMWHINNEYGCHLNTDYSDAARDAFRTWLTARYGSIEALNTAWGTDFWSQRYGGFDEILPPRKAPYSRNPSAVLDFRRFTSDMLIECYVMERDVLRAAGATQPMTTNFMGPFKPADYFRWAELVDVVADDCYPDPSSADRVRDIAFQRDLMRSLKPGVPWILMEQAANAVNWRPSNASKPEGRLVAESLQSVARGADGVMFFQWRQSAGGAEKFHSAMLPQAGTSARSWHDVVGLGARLGALETLPAPDREARVALVFDWENWWAVEGSDHPVVIDYLAEVREWYGALHGRSVQVDIVPPERIDRERYDLVVAPFLYLLRDEGAARLRAFVEAGGVLAVGPFSDVVDADDRFRTGGFLTQLGPVLGVGLDDFGALAAHPGGVAMPSPARDAIGVDWAGEPFRGSLLAEDLRAEGAEVLARFTDGIPAGQPALTRNAFGEGEAWYVGTQPDRGGIARIVDALLDRAGAEPVLPGLPTGVEAARRGDVVFLINHSAAAVQLAVDAHDLESGASVTGVDLAPEGVAVLRIPASARPASTLSTAVTA
ncbi:MAG: beta-galactosidase [Microbacteriaceae bacterium]